MFRYYSFYPSAILGQWGIIVASGICPSVCLYVCLSVHPISPSLYKLLTSNHHCTFTMPITCTPHHYVCSQTFELGVVTFSLTLLVTTKLPERNITSMPKRYICCILPISQTSSKDSDLGWSLVQYCLNKMSHQCQNCTFVCFANISNEFWLLTYFSRSDGSMPHVCLSIQFLLAYIHDWHQTITAYLPCSVLVPHTIILDLRSLIVAWWLWPGLCLLPQNYLNQTSHQSQNGTFAAFANIWDEFEGQWSWWTFDPLFKVRWVTSRLVTTIPSNITSMLKWYIWWILQISYISFKDSESGWTLTYFSMSDRLQLSFLELQYLNQTPHECQNGSFGASW